jgi:ABC-type Fe3+/spermidine/putrescine transport system ATPase subunit
LENSAHLEFDDVSIFYGGFKAVSNCSFSVRKGELFTFLGPSGSGKSTILLGVAGFVSPKEGNIRLNGTDITFQPPNKRGVGMVFQSYALFPHKDVFDNVAYPLKIRRKQKPEIQDRVGEMLKTVQLQEKRNSMPHQLSGGQQQRVALARALVFNPSLLLLDEPLGSLDKKLREQMQFEIRRIQRSSETTTLYVTHDQNEAMAISDRIAILREGAIEQIGTPREIYEDPANIFVADFIGGANFIPVQVVSIEARTCAVNLTGHIIRGIPRPKWLTKNGGKGRLMVRPTHIRMVNGMNRDDDGIPCTIEESYYLGDNCLIRCVLADKTQIQVSQSGSQSLGSNFRGYLHFPSEMSRLFVESDATTIGGED